MPLVLDASAALAWCFADESHHVVDSAIARLSEDRGLVPAVWSFEVANALVGAELRGRLDRSRVMRSVELLLSLPLEPDSPTTSEVLGRVSNIAREYRLTAYDASYLELAMRSRATLATLDQALSDAARKAGVELVE